MTGTTDEARIRDVLRLHGQALRIMYAEMRLTDDANIEVDDILGWADEAIRSIRVRGDTARERAVGVLDGPVGDPGGSDGEGGTER